jgi:hypothetical protein
MADDIVSLSGEGLKFGRSPANGELLVGNGGGFNLSTLTAGSNVTITNSSGGITISATSSGGTVTSVTGTAPITSTGGATPNIALTVPVAVQYGGTGLATITANSLVAGNGTGAVNLVAPGSSGTSLVSNGTVWASAYPQYSVANLTDPSGQASVIYTGLVSREYTFIANVIQPNSTATTVRFEIALSADSGGSWTTVNFSGSTNWQANGGGSGLVSLYPEFGVGAFFLVSNNIIASAKTSANTIVPTGSAIPINAIRFRWFDTGTSSVVNFRTLAGQSIKVLI